MGPTKLLLERDMQALMRSRFRVLAAGIGVGLGFEVVYFLFLSESRGWLLFLARQQFGSNLGGIDIEATVSCLFIVPAFVLFLGPVLYAEWRVRDSRIQCPSCQHDATRQFRQVLTTRKCPQCQKRLVADGRLRNPQAHRRQRDRIARRILRRWLYLWPILAVAALTWCLYDPDQLNRNAACVWMGPLLGVACSGWVYLRTRDRYCLPPLFASLLTMAATGAMFCYA